METHKVSIVIPVYKAAQYLPECLRSLCAQTYKDLEIICVYDSSPDDSLAVLQSYAEKDERIKVIINPAGSLSSPGRARNIGMDAATGSFVRFVDADDAIPLDSTAILCSFMNSPDVDAVRGCFAYASETLDAVTAVAGPGKGSEVAVALTPRDQFPPFCLHLFYGHFANLFRLDRLRAWGVRYPDTVKGGEDAIFLYDSFFKIDKLVVIPDIVYTYRTWPDSAMKRKQAFAWYKEIMHTYSYFYQLAIASDRVRIADYYFVASLCGYLKNTILSKLEEDLQESEIQNIYSLARKILVSSTVLNHLEIFENKNHYIAIDDNTRTFISSISTGDFLQARALL